MPSWISFFLVGVFGIKLVAQNHANVFYFSFGSIRTADGDVGNQRKVCFLCKRNPYVKTESINARAETLTELPSFKLLVDRRRCIIPADGFYE